VSPQNLDFHIPLVCHHRQPKKSPILSTRCINFQSVTWVNLHPVLTGMADGHRESVYEMHFGLEGPQCHRPVPMQKGFDVAQVGQLPNESRTVTQIREPCGPMPTEVLPNGLEKLHTAFRHVAAILPAPTISSIYHSGQWCLRASRPPACRVRSRVAVPRGQSVRCWGEIPGSIAGRPALPD
jgi:hypothetical protein